MDNIKKQIAWLRAQHDKLALSDATITGYSEAADTMEKLLAVCEAVEALREYPTCNYRIVNGNQVELIGLRPLVKATAAVQTTQSLTECPECGDQSYADDFCVSEHCEPDDGHHET